MNISAQRELTRPQRTMWVTGRKYYQTELALCLAGEHDGVIVREPTNEYDTNAIRIDVGPHKVGYVPKDRAAKLAPWMDQQGHATLDCRVLVIEPDHMRTQWAAQLIGIYQGVTS